MRKWGIIISLFYLLVVLVLLVPGALLIADVVRPLSPDFDHILASFYGSFGTWILIGVLVAGEVLLLFLSADTQWRHLRPRAHILVTSATAAALLLLLTLSAFTNLIFAAILEDPAFDMMQRLSNSAVLPVIAIWLFWAGLFYLYAWKRGEAATRAVNWLLRGSILELLVAVPCHVIVRRRDDCCAPIVTGLGITTGLAIMLLSFGPSVLFLYKKRLAEYPKRMAS